MRTLTFIVLFATLLPSLLIGQDYSTWAEIYDFEAGDIFHFITEDNGSIIFYRYTGVENVQVLDKSYSKDSSSVSYYQFVQKAIYRPEDPTYEFREFYDTVTFDNLNNIFVADTIIISEKYNFRKQSHFDSIHTPYSKNIGHYVDGCGLAYHFKYHFYGPTWWDDLTRELVYFKKDDQEWGTPHIVAGISEAKDNMANLRFRPNPFSTSTTLSYTLDSPENIRFTVYNVQSQIVFDMQEKQTAGEKRIAFNAEGLPAGMYFYRLQVSDQVASGKLVVRD